MLKNKKNIAVLGATGSIGKQTLNIVLNKPQLFRVFLISCNKNHKLLCEQAIIFKPKYGLCQHGG
jgi:1-deoxy-D-xylulose 5-phosphate reductoisomerase